MWLSVIFLHDNHLKVLPPSIHNRNHILQARLHNEEFYLDQIGFPHSSPKIISRTSLLRDKTEQNKRNKQTKEKQQKTPWSMVLKIVFNISLNAQRVWNVSPPGTEWNTQHWANMKIVSIHSIQVENLLMWLAQPWTACTTASLKDTCIHS